MPAVHPFTAIRYAASKSADLSALVAPPYDVLDAAAKSALLVRNPHNIVAVDLPHLPVKELGPADAYAEAGRVYRDWLATGVLARAQAPAMFVYRQIFESNTAGGRSTFQRTGMACAVETVPFGPRPGGGILPHEETFSGPKADRLALMTATAAQLSPIFGLHQDDRGEASALLRRTCAARAPDITADMGDGVRHEVWTVMDSPTLASYQHSLAAEDIFIADGHHRYNTALNYLASLEQSGPVPHNHPARRCLMVLVGMSDPGMVIWPTHRVLGGMNAYSWDRFLLAAKDHLAFQHIPGGLKALDAAVQDPRAGPNRLGFYDFATGAGAIGSPPLSDPLAAKFSSKPAAWRALDVALVQHLVVEQVCAPSLSASGAITWAFPHTVAEVEAIGRGSETSAGGGKGFTPQLAIILRPTPLESVRTISRAGELMPQKSTFFYPKLATGLFIHPLR